MSFHSRNSKDSTLAHAWANGLPVPKGCTTSRVRYYSDADSTIYSYGQHFPIAKHYNKAVLFTLQTNSMTTGKHIRAVQEAVSHKHVVYAYYLGLDDYDKNRNIEWWIANIKASFVKMKAARKKEKYAAEVEHERDLAKKYIDFMKVKLTKAQKDKLFNSTVDGWDALLKKEQAAKDRENKKFMKLQAEAYDKFLLLFREGKELDRDALPSNEYGLAEARLHRLDISLLRVVGDKINTSKRIDIPIDAAHRYYKKYLAVVNAGECDGNCSFKMMDFDVKVMSADQLIVGCHTIPRSEIDYIAKELNW